MPIRTAQDFVDEVAEADPWQLKLADGTVITPKPRAHFTYDDELGEARCVAAWQKWFADHPTEEPPSDPKKKDYVEPPFEYDLRTRFGADREAFWAEWAPKPKKLLHALLRDLDAHYDPEPATDAEKAAADAEGPEGETAGK